jgi:hypothetical protein
LIQARQLIEENDKLHEEVKRRAIQCKEIYKQLFEAQQEAVELRMKVQKIVQSKPVMEVGYLPIKNSDFEAIRGRQLEL